MLRPVGTPLVLVIWFFSSVLLAGEITIDSLTVTKLMGNMYRVDYTGKLKLTDIGGGFEQWASLTLEVSQPGTNAQVSIVSLTQPKLGTDGSYSATANVFENINNKDWKAYAIINVYIDAKMTIKSTTAEKSFTVP